MMCYIFNFSMQTTGGNFPLWIAYAAAIILLFLIIALCYAMRKESYFHEAPQALLDQLPIEDIAPLTRRDVENGWIDTERWKCVICEFSNSSKKKHCILCGTEQGIKIETNSTSRPLHQLNVRQQTARQRKKWKRQLALDGTYYWCRNSSLVEKENNTTERPSFGLVARLVENARMSNQDSFVDNSHRLTFADCTVTSAAIASRGYEIATSDLHVLEHVSSLSFPDKYKWFLEQTGELMRPWEDGRLKLRVNRDNVLVESMEQLLGIQMEHIHMPLRIEFINEAGIDAGGLQREWVGLLCESLFNDATGLFKTCHGHQMNHNSTFTINPHSLESSVDHLLYFRGVGRFLGRILLEGQLLQARLCLPLFKHFLGVPLTLSDLRYFDQDIHKNMEWILNNDNIEALGLTFSMVEEHSNHEIEVVDLKPNGQYIAVTDENKEEYIYLRFKYIMLGSVAPQLQHILTGLFEVIPQELIMVFDYQELEIVLCGIPEIDLEDWRMFTQVSDDLIGSELLEWFWEIVEAMSQEQRSRLLQLCTGSSQVPVQGFKGLTSYDGRICLFTLKAVPYHDRAYPHAHTCFNRIDLPMYKTKQELEEILHLVINMELTGFTGE